jgi:cobalt/nickel transport protein
MSKLATFTLAGLAVALLVGVVLSDFANPNPDGLESAVLRTQCADQPAGDRRTGERCLAEAAGDPIYTAAPLPDYAITPLSGVLGVLACFVIGAGVVALVRARRAGVGGREPPMAG